MQPNQQDILITYLLFPSVVALLTAFTSAMATYFASYRLQKKDKEEEHSQKVEDLVNRLLIETNRLIPLFEKLSNDFDKDNFFSFANIDLISNARWRFVNISNESTVFEESLRKEVLENGDRVSTLIDEMNAIERNPVQGHTDLKTKLEEAIKEERHLKIELLKIDITFTDEDGILVPRYVTDDKKTEATDKKLEVANEMRQSLISGVNDQQRRLDDINRETDRRRERLVSKIIDIQNKLKDLQANLLSLK